MILYAADHNDNKQQLYNGITKLLWPGVGEASLWWPGRLLLNNLIKTGKAA